MSEPSYKPKIMYFITNTSKKLTVVQDWDILYNKYHGKAYNSNTLKNEVK